MAHLRAAVLLAAALALPARAAPPADDDLADEVEVSTRTPLTAREAPGIVTVIGRDEIEAAGVRDLLDLLELVPGFAPAVDVEGVVSVGFRGLWGHEGKILFLLDGQELNETLFSTMQLGGRIPIDLVERVEIVRGPGSALYGGNAELAVIHVFTRRARDLSGAAGTVSVGRMGTGFGHASATASAGGILPGRPEVAAALHVGRSERVRSDATYRDFLGNRFDMRRDAGLSDTFVSLALQAGRTGLRAVHDEYVVESRDGVDVALPEAERVRFESTLLELRHELRPEPGLTLTPRIAYKRHTPWQAISAPDLLYDKTADRLLGGVLAAWEHRTLSVTGGVEAFWDRARVNRGGQDPFAGGNRADWTTTSAFAQLLLRQRIANLHVGARYDYNTGFGGAFVPRVGLTRVAGRTHAKLLLSQAYRAPSIENENANPAIRPERTYVAEAEVGMQLWGHVALVANAFWMRIERPIVFSVDPDTAADRYDNGSRTGTTGLEAQARAKYAWGFANLGYSSYTASGQNRVDLYAVPGRRSVLLGFPTHKLTLHGGWNVRRRAVLGANAVLLGQRWAWRPGDAPGVPQLGSEPATLLLGASLTFRDVGTRGLDLSLGVRNLLDEPNRAPQPFDANHMPLPLGGREIGVRLAFHRSASGR